MDLSRQTISDDTSCAGVSMYLSFESNSTMSSAAYKTMEAMSDISAVSTMEQIDLNDNEESSESHQNSTLEAADVDLSHMKTVKKVDQIPLGTASPLQLRAFPKNIMQEYKALSSTPTKEQLMRSVEVSRGSEVPQSMDLGVAFMGVEDDKNMFFHEDNKENAHPESEGSTLSSSVEIVTSVIEKKQTTLSTTEEVSMQDVQEVSSEKKLDPVATPKANIENEVKKDIPLSSGLRKPKSNIPQNKLYRKSVCEPNLNTNRPSRIASKRLSVSANTKRSELRDQTDIPKLLDKLLKISNVVPDQPDDEVDTQSTMNTNENVKVPGKAKGRSSLLPQAEKRPFSFTQRMSIVVKTTLNSPARKIARKSLIPNGQVSGVPTRRSIAPSGAASGSYNPPRRSVMPNMGASRRSMLPTSSTSSQTRTSNQLVVTERTQLLKSTKRQTILPTRTQNSNQLKPLPELVEKPKSTIPIKSKISAASKQESTFTCSVCSQKFRIKSLLDAHKRSHEGENQPAATMIKKPSVPITTASTSTKESTQCKYCDKKFAIVRALHIHLLQNCAKIPPGDKRKLQYTEMNHVEKAQLPMFSNNTNNTSSTKTLTKSHSNLSSAQNSSVESLVVKKEITVITQELVTAVEKANSQMSAPSTTKLKKAAHAGVYRTPSKSVPCHICKQSFKSILEYTNHSLTMHSSQTLNENTPDEHMVTDDTQMETEN